jgi:parallel beta-helix repeat protein
LFLAAPLRFFAPPRELIIIASKSKLMIKHILSLLLFLFFSQLSDAQEKAITSGMKITRSVKLKKSIYRLDAPTDTSRTVIVITGNNITLDFAGIELRGSNKKKTPDEFFGIAILIRDGQNITIKNLKARGYKVALLARNVKQLTLSNCDFSYNYRPHLNSTQEKEDVSDWMSYHHNEKDEWLRYGAAMYLRGCDAVVVKDCRVTGGQNALMMTECNDGKIYNNDFSFNSGIGIGMYRSNRNLVLYNKLIFNVRGYSHGVYNRGQDSAGILVYEQSNNNTFYKNNATHGGDGFFLWAGQTTMDTGQGGCNDNLIMANDFSYAPTNGIEVTFSRNKIIDNRLYECAHGIWGGYSYETNISSNKFRNNTIDIAIEHGQQNSISYNISLRSKEAIRLWARREQPADWGYARHRDTRSRNYVIAFNNFSYTGLVFNLARTDSLNIFSNLYGDNERLFKRDSTVTNLDVEENGKIGAKLSLDTATSVPVIDKPANPFKDVAAFAGRRNIRMTEWGPYDFRSPIIWHTNPIDSTDALRFDILGPKGKWKIKRYRGVDSISAMSGTFPASITAIRKKEDRTDIKIELEYTGAAFTTVFGEKAPANKPYAFSFTKFFQPLDWEVLFYSLDTSMHNPVTTGSLFSPVEKKAPFKTEKVNKLDYSWWGGIKQGDVQHKQFITIASAQADIPPGEYELSVTWDDAVRIYAGDSLVIDEWNPSKYKFDESPNRKVKLKVNGVLQLRVEHLELGGFATLALKLKKLDK